jgi:hypothetical protein
MQNNFFNRFLLSLVFFKSERVETRDEAFERLKKLVLSVRDKEDLINAVKLINHFNQTYKVGEDSPEFLYFTKMIRLMKLIIRKKGLEMGEENDESQRICLILEE